MTTVQGLIGCSVHQHGIPHEVRAGDSHSNRRGVGVSPGSRNPACYSTLCYTDAAGLIEHWNSLLQAQPQHQLRANTLRTGCQTPRCNTCSASETSVQCRVFNRKDMWVQAPGDGSRCGLIYLPSLAMTTEGICASPASFGRVAA